MKSLISFLIMFALWLVPIIIKSRSSRKKAVSGPRTLIEEEEQMTDVLETESNLLNSDENYENPSEYFTYETLENDSEKSSKKRTEKVSEKVQIAEIEEEPHVELTFDEDEMLKGVIYSEILKRKFN